MKQKTKQILTAKHYALPLIAGLLIGLTPPVARAGQDDELPEGFRKDCYYLEFEAQAHYSRKKACNLPPEQHVCDRVEKKLNRYISDYLRGDPCPGGYLLGVNLFDPYLWSDRKIYCEGERWGVDTECSGQQYVQVCCIYTGGHGN